jgi:hypothetical protein
MPDEPGKVLGDFEPAVDYYPNSELDHVGCDTGGVLGADDAGDFFVEVEVKGAKVE